MSKEKDFKALCLQALPIVKKASEFIKGEHGKVSQDSIETKELNSLVSYVDKTAEEILVDGLGKILPEAQFLTEEETVVQGNGKIRWIIDPLDGTTNFLHQIPHYAVSVGLEIDNELVAGIVEHVPHEEQYYAWTGGGAFLNNRRIISNQNQQLSDAVVATGFPYNAQSEEAISDLIVYWMKNARSIRRFGSAALDLIYVARGIFDFYYELSLNAWDIAGGAVIVKEAGGQVSDFYGSEEFLTEGRILASNGNLHDEVLKILKHHF